ncbi:MAG: hypothetical protein GY714_09200 [Desulfobacterales bacterium]|nr:hypothetical protein [Desulfobacterales bacterium]
MSNLSWSLKESKIPSAITMDQFREISGMSFVEKGMVIIQTSNNRRGHISGANSSSNLKITFDGDVYSQNCHSKWMIKYFDSKNNLIKEYKAYKEIE